MLYVPSPSLRWNTYPRFTSTSRVKKNVCGGGNVATDPRGPSATSTRLAARTPERPMALGPPNWCCCAHPPVSRQMTLGIVAVEKPFSPASYLYATHGSFVRAIASIWIRFVPRYTVNRRLPSKMPSFMPGNVTARLPPSLFTSHDDAENSAPPRRISSFVRGSQKQRPPVKPGGFGEGL